MKFQHLLFLLFMTACQPKESTQPSPIFFKPEPAAESPEFYDLSEIQDAGVLIGGMVSGPDTYYEYRGQGFGMQFLLAEEFAQEIGCRLQLEIAQDTATLWDKLEKGEIDFIAMDIPRWQTRDDTPLLREAIRQWWKPLRKQQMLDAIQNRKEKAHRSVRPVMRDAAQGIISLYDQWFYQYSKTLGWDWRLLASLCYQESGFDPNAVSWAGAQGLMQIMPATSAALGVDAEKVFDPETNIAAGVRYLKKLHGLFSDIPDPMDRICFTLASYNGGSMHIRDAMALAGKYGNNPLRWRNVAPFVLNLSDPMFYNDPVVKHGYMRGSETHAYVENIITRWQQYRGSARATYTGSNPVPSQSSIRDGEFQTAVKSAQEWVGDSTETSP